MDADAAGDVRDGYYGLREDWLQVRGNGLFLLRFFVDLVCGVAGIDIYC